MDDTLLSAGKSWRKIAFTVALLAIAVLPLLWTKPVTVWCGSAPSSQLKVSASQWPHKRTILMPCTAKTARFL